MTARRTFQSVVPAIIVTMTVGSASAMTTEEFARQIGLGGADLMTVVLNVIRLVLGLVGIVAVIMLLIGGFQWMLSLGDEERIAKAKRTMSATIVGLIIILLSWAIVSFVIQTTGNVSGAP